MERINVSGIYRETSRLAEMILRLLSSSELPNPDCQALQHRYPYTRGSCISTLCKAFLERRSIGLRLPATKDVTVRYLCIYSRTTFEYAALVLELFPLLNGRLHSIVVARIVVRLPR